MMRPISLILMTTCFIFFTHSAIAQYEKREIAVKIYGNLLYFNSPYVPLYLKTDTSFINYIGWNTAISYKKKDSRIVHEIEPKIRIRSRFSGEIQDKEIGLRYGLNKYLQEELFKGLRFRWGFTARAYYYYGEVKQGVLSPYLLKRTIGGLEATFTMQIEYKLSEQIRLYLKSTNATLNFSGQFERLFNPVLTENQQKQGGFGWDLRGQRILKLGVGWLFSS